jgi:hypothetical protein
VAAGWRFEVMENRMVRRLVVSSIARLCENSSEAISEHEKEVRITFGENKNAV